MNWHKLIPKTIKIGLVDYTIKLLSIADARAFGHFGRTIYHQHTIELDESMTEARVKQVLLHEIMHAIWAEKQLDLADKLEKKDKEEFIVEHLSTGLCEVFYNNSSLYTFLKYQEVTNTDATFWKQDVTDNTLPTSTGPFKTLTKEEQEQLEMKYACQNV